MRIVREPLGVTQLDAELLNLKVYKDDLKSLQDKVDLQTELVAMMLQDLGKKSTVSGTHRYTIVQAERTKINEAGLKKALGARVFNKLTKQVLDQGKVKAAISEGTLDPIVLEQYAEVVLNKPAIRISEVQPDE